MSAILVGAVLSGINVVIMQADHKPAIEEFARHSVGRLR